MICIVDILAKFWFEIGYTGVFRGAHNKEILCKNDIVQLKKKWMIHNNRFFTNGTKFHTIIFCKSMD